MKTIIFTSLAAAIFLSLAVSPARAQGNIAELENRFKQVKKVVDDPLTDEAGIRKAIRELERLNEASNASIEDESNASKKSLALAGAVAETLRFVKSRIPADLKSAKTKRPGFPVPKFEIAEFLASLSSELDRAQTNLAQKIRKTDEPGGETEKLLFEVSKAQEKIAWEAGWPFTKPEAEQVRKAGKLTDAVYASRLSRGVKRINQQIGQETDANGRVRERPFVIHLSADETGRKLMAQHLEKVRQIGGSLPEEVTRVFDGKEAEALKGNADSRKR